MRLKIAISGAGIGGPTLAYWLRRAGHEVLLIEVSPQFRTGGYIIDFWGAGYDVAEKMGLIRRVRQLGYQVREVRLVDAHGRYRGGFSTDVLDHITRGRFTSIQRSALSATIYAALEGEVETMFGDSVVAVHECGERVRLSFEHAAARNVDLLVGADGLHSRVRSLVFGHERCFEVALGYHVAAFEATGYRPRDDLIYVGHGAPGRQISRFSLRDDKTLFLFVWRDEYLGAAGADLSSDDARKAALGRAFMDVGWEAPEILHLARQTNTLYFDRVSQIRMNRWTSGRTVLVGDAAAGVSLLAGEGTGLAMAEGYVLAGELARAGGDHRIAFARYEDQMMPLLLRKQEAAAKFASAFAPRTALGIVVRSLATRLLRFPRIADTLFGGNLRDDIDLPDYGPFWTTRRRWPRAAATTGYRQHQAQ